MLKCGFFILKLEGCVGSCAHLQLSDSWKLQSLLPGGYGEELGQKALVVVQAVLVAHEVLDRHRLSITILVSTL